MADEPARTSWWTTMPGVLTALAGIITALTGFVAILVQTGVIGGKDKAPATLSVAQAPTPSPSASGSASKAADPPAASSPAPAKPVVDGTATGVSDKPLSRSNFTGAVITRQDGSVTKVRDDIKEYCQGRPVLVTEGGQTVEMARMQRFDVTNWNNGKGTVHIVLNNGEAVDARIGACYFDGTNDLGAVRVDFENIKSVEFVR